MNKNIEESAANAILEEPFIIEVPTSGLLQLMRVKKIKLKVKPIRWGTKVKISGLLNRLETADKESVENRPVKTGFTLVSKNAWYMSRMIALAILNSRLSMKLFSRPLASFLYWNLDSARALNIMIEVVKRCNIRDFMSTIVFLNGLNETAPKNQETSRHSTGETIAPGEPQPNPSNTGEYPGSSHSGE